MKITAKELKEYSQSLNILYAEDEEILRESMQATLTKLFKNVYIAKNGQEALYLYDHEEIDIVLTDINMPIMSGLVLVETIKERENEDVPIIVLSAHNESKLLINLINAGTDYFINKPVDKEKLILSLYKTAKSVFNAKMITYYADEMQSSLDEMDRKNRILEKKFKELAYEKNLNQKKKPDQIKTTAHTHSDYYDNLLIEDKDELEDLSQELDSYITQLFSKEEMSSNYINKLTQVLNKYGAILNSYPEFSQVGLSIEAMAAEITLHQHKLLEDREVSGMFLESFHLSLDSFKKNIWNTKAKDPSFYNASLLSDISSISVFLQNVEIEGDMEFF